MLSRCRCSLSRLSRRCTRTPLIGSSIENGTTIIQFICANWTFKRCIGDDLDDLLVQGALLCRGSRTVDVHNPIKYRFIVAQGSYLNKPAQRCTSPGHPGRLDLPAYEHR